MSTSNPLPLGPRRDTGESPPRSADDLSKRAPAPPKPTRRHSADRLTLSLGESTLAFAVFVVWMALFAGGILVDTKPYRLEISASGVAALERASSPQNESSAQGGNGSRAQATAPAGAPAGGPRPTKAQAWIVVLLCFLPLNLAWICAASSTLGAFGNRANLSDDQISRRFRDLSNPYVSAVLRGFFIYLFMLSGLLLLDDAPFSNPAPGQYVRLAGFLSLFSFLVSYQPRLFSVLIVWAFQRIQVREGETEENGTEASLTDTVYAKRTTVEVAAKHSTGVDHTPSP